MKLSNLFVDINVFLFFWCMSLLRGKKIIILSDRYGNIGNQLYMSGFLVHWSCAYKGISINYGLIGYQNYFQQTSNNFLISYPSCNNVRYLFHDQILKIFSTSANRISLRLINSKQLSIYSINLLRIKTDNDYQITLRKILKRNIIFVRGFIHNRNYKELTHVFTKIKAHLNPVKELNFKIREPLKKLSSSEIIVGVAIRQGDYRFWNNGIFFLETSVYIKWILELKKFFLNSKVGFFIASEEEQDLSKFEDFNYYLRVGNPISNLHTLSKCDYIMSVPSSFAGWAHFIGKTPLLLIDKNVRKINVNDFITL